MYKTFLKYSNENETPDRMEIHVNLRDGDCWFYVLSAGREPSITVTVSKNKFGEFVFSEVSEAITASSGTITSKFMDTVSVAQQLYFQLRMLIVAFPDEQKILDMVTPFLVDGHGWVTP